MEVSPEGKPPANSAGHAHEAEHEQAHAQPHSPHGDDPSNPIYFGLPIGVIIAATISAIAVSITLIKFFYFKS